MKKYDRCSGYEEGYDDGHDDGYRDGEREAKPDPGWFRRELTDQLLEAVDVRRRGAALPLPIYAETMTLDEVEKLITSCA